jgi:hypothetical protein
MYIHQDKFNLMKHLPATIGLLAILTLLVFFRGDPDRAVQAAPTTNYETMISPADTTVRPSSDTLKHHQKIKNNKKKSKTVTKPMRDTLIRDTL